MTSRTHDRFRGDLNSSEKVGHWTSNARLHTILRGADEPVSQDSDLSKLKKWSHFPAFESMLLVLLQSCIIIMIMIIDDDRLGS